VGRQAQICEYRDNSYGWVDWHRFVSTGIIATGGQAGTDL
jgi:hypothetical protein